MKNLIKIVVLFTSLYFLDAFAQPIPPGGGGCTNCPSYTNNYIPPPYVPGLKLSIPPLSGTNLRLNLLEADPAGKYDIFFASNLPLSSWSDMLQGTNGQTNFILTFPSSGNGFFRTARTDVPVINTSGMTVTFLNPLVNTNRVQAAVAGGPAAAMAVLVNNTNFMDATWIPFSAVPLVLLGTNDGTYQVWFGFIGADGQTNWTSVNVTVDTVPPLLVITNPTVRTVSVPMIQINGYCPEALANISYDLTNATGLVTNQDAGITAQYYDTNTFKLTTNYFECLDIPLTNGLNIITLQATDLAGNTTITNLSVTLDYSSRTNPPVVKLYWPQDGTLVCNGDYTWRGWVDDPTATVTVQLVNTNGNTNIVNGIVERNGNFWVENLPLSGGTNFLMLTLTDSAGKVAVTNITVFPSAVALTINTPSSDQLWNKYVNVTGTISDSDDYTVWVNGVKATNNADGTWTATNVYFPEGGTAVIQARAISNSNNGGNGVGGSGGGPVSYDNLGNPDPLQDNDAELQTDKPAEIDWSSDYCFFSYTADDGTYYNEVHVSWCPDLPYDIFDDYTWNYPDDTGWIISYRACPAWPECEYDGEYDAGYVTIICDDNGVITTSTGSGSEPWYPGSEHCAMKQEWRDGLYERKTQTTFKLVTGGKGNSHRQNIFKISGSAVQYLELIGDDEIRIPSQSITVMGKSLGSDGNLYVMLPDNDERDVTPHVSGVDYYGFNVDQQKYHPYITANSHNLDNETPEFCVGQRVTFAVSGLPSYVDSLQHWSLSGNFKNDQTPTVPGKMFPTCSMNYFVNSDLLATNTTTAWWVSGGSPETYTASIWENLHFSNGQYVSIAALGKFNMYRPQAKISPVTTSVNVIDGNKLAFDSPIGEYGITFFNTITVPAGFSGSTKWVQVVTDTVANYQDTNSIWHVATQNGPSPYGDTPIPYEAFDDNNNPVDAPSLLLFPLTLPPHYVRAVASGNYEMWMMFQPDGGVWVPLRAVNWSWSGSATNGPGGWGLQSGTDSPNPTDFDTETYPLWRSDVQNYQFIPPLF